MPHRVFGHGGAVRRGSRHQRELERPLYPQLSPDLPIKVDLPDLKDGVTDAKDVG